MTETPIPSKQPSIPWPDHVQGIAERFAEVVRAVPDVVAASDPERSLTYADLDARSSRLAARLQNHGSVGEPVALLIDHDVDLVVAMLAAVRAGRPYSVIDPVTPAQRMLQVCDDLGTAVIVTSPLRAALAQQLALGLAPVIDVSDDGGPCLDTDAVAQATAGIFYTSGSTGEPKGGMRSQSGIVRRVRFENSITTIGPGDVVSLLYSCSYGSSQNDLWTGLLSGARVAMYPVAALGVAPLAAWIRDEELTWLHMPIALLRQFISLLPTETRFETLRVIIPSGRQYGSDITALRAHLPESARIYSQFGSTETSIAARYVIEPTDEFGDGQIIPIGWEVPDARIDIVDEEGHLVPDGEEGQLLISSAMLSHGYWNRPEQTDAVFTPDPERPGFRRYATGDYGRRDELGRVVFIGRRDDRVKVRGYRIELNEVAGHIRSLEAAGEAHVAVDPHQGDRMVAYVVPALGCPFDAGALRTELAARVPRHLVPSLFVETPALPLTPNGKIDPTRLPDIGELIPQTAAAFEPPSTDTERLIADIWAETLGVAEIGVHDGFAELGGDSIGAMRVVALVADRCQTEIPLRRLLDQGTVASMAELVDGSPTTVTALRGAGAGPHPLTHQQMNIWLSEQIGAAGRFNMVKLVDLDGPLDPNALQQALTDLSARHDVLRTVFGFAGAEPTQIVLDPEAVPLAVEDLSGMTPQQVTGVITAIIERHGAIPFRLDRDRPLRAELCVLGPAHHVLVFTTHHIASDRTSSVTLFDDLGHLYRAAIGREAPPPALPHRYVDFAHWQRERLTPTATEAALAYWRRVLDPTPEELRPLVRALEAVDAGHESLDQWEFDPEVSDHLITLAREENTTVFIVMLALLKMALVTVTGISDPVVSAIMSGRDRAELNGMVGCFITVCPVVSTTPSDVDFRERIRIERDAMLAVLDHADVPFDAVVGALNPARRAGRTPFADVTLNFGSSGAPDLDFGTAVGRRRLAKRDADNPFDVRAWLVDGRITGQITFDAAWVDPAVAARVDHEIQSSAQRLAERADG